ncbi:MAG: hypothetical protein AB1489_40110, partial [Acidobacteriota bacterium]
ISFPAELLSHPGWRDAAAMLQHKHMLESEADAVIIRLAKLLQNSDKKIGLFYGADREVNDILKQRLDTYFSLREVRDLRGSFFTQVLIYRADSTQQ